MARYLAIDGDHGVMHVAAASVNRGAARVEKALTLAESQPVTAANAAELGRRLREFLKAAGVAPAPVLVCVGRERVIVKEIRYPAVSPAEEPAVVRFQASKELTDPPDEVVVDYFPLPSADAGGERRAAAVVIRKEIVKAYKTLCEAAGLKLVAITPRPIATAAALQRAIAGGAVTPVDSLSASVAILARGDKWGELSIARGGEVVFTRTLSAPALASEPALLGELRRNIAVYSGQNQQSPVQALYVAEAESPAGWSGRVRAGLTIPVHAFDPLAGVQTDSPPEHRGTFAGLAGMFALKSRAEDLPLNFVTPREPKPPRDPNKKLVALVAPVLALLLVGGVAFGFMAKMEKQKTIARLQREKADLDTKLEELEVDAKRIKALDDWTGRGVVLLDELYDLTSRFPDIGGTRLQSLTVTPREPDKNARVKYVTHLELKLETEDSKAVDRMLAEMVRDGHYNVHPKESKSSGAGAGVGSSRFNQTFIVRAETLPRKPGEYVRKLNVSPPPRRGTPSEELKVEPAEAVLIVGPEGQP